MLSERRVALLRSPSVGQAARFVVSGGFVALVYVAVTSLLSEVAGLQFEAALAIGFVVAITTHFTLQRLFVWTHVTGFALPFRHQVLRYLLLAGLQYAATAVATATLPRSLGVATEIVYLCTAALLSVVNFVLFRTGVFHPSSHPPTV